VLRVKFIPVSAFKEKKQPEKCQINNLMMYLKLLEKQQSKPENSTWNIKIKAEINEMETKNTTKTKQAIFHYIINS
jgi:hypothetical protein